MVQALYLGELADVGLCHPSTAWTNLASFLNSQTLAAFGTACIDHCTATAGFHANQKTVGTGAANFRRLVSAFHVALLSGKPRIITNFLNPDNALARFLEIYGSLSAYHTQGVDMFLIN